MASAFALRMDEDDRLVFRFFDPTGASGDVVGVMDRPDAEAFFREGLRLLQESKKTRRLGGRRS